MPPTHSSLQVRQALKSLGFSEHETNVLTYLFRARKSTAREVSQQTAISFSTTQYVLSNLASIGAVRHTSGATDDTYEAITREEFLVWVDEQKSEVQMRYDHAKDEVKSFFEFVDEGDWKPRVMYFEGREEMVKLYEDIIDTCQKTGSNVYSWQDIAEVNKIFGHYVDDYIKRRKESHITSYALMPKNETNMKHSQNDELRQTRFVEGLEVKGQVRVYDSKVAFITLYQDSPIGFVFRGKVMANLFRNIFKSCWQNTPPASEQK